MKKILFFALVLLLLSCGRDEPSIVQQSSEPKYTAENIAGTWKATHYDSPNDNMGWVAEPDPPTRQIVFTNSGTFTTSTMPVMWNNGYVYTGTFVIELTGKLHATTVSQQGIDFSVEFSDESHGIITFFDANSYHNIMQYKIVK